MWSPDYALQVLPFVLIVICFALGVIAGQQR